LPLLTLSHLTVLPIPTLSFPRRRESIFFSQTNRSRKNLYFASQPVRLCRACAAGIHAPHFPRQWLGRLAQESKSTRPQAESLPFLTPSHLTVLSIPTLSFPRRRRIHLHPLFLRSRNWCQRHPAHVCLGRLAQGAQRVARRVGS